ILPISKEVDRIPARARISHPCAPYGEESISMFGFTRWILGLILAILVTAVPIVQYRWTYTHSKRLREVAPGKFYRSGEMTAPGFREAIADLGIRTIINLQDEYPDPGLSE